MCIAVWISCFSVVDWFGLLLVAVDTCDFKVNFTLRGGCLYLVLGVGMWIFVVLWWWVWDCVV